MNIAIRAAVPQDAPTVNQILTETWKAAYIGIVPQEYLDSLDAAKPNRMQEDISARTLEVLLLFADGVPAGAVGYGSSREESRAGWGEIVCLYLRPAYWRRGYGGKLLRAAVDALTREGFRKFYLWVMAENRSAREFYRAMGFEPTGEASFYEIAGKRMEDVRYIKKTEK